MNQLISDALDDLRENADADNPLVFPSLKTGGRIVDIKKGFAKACREAGLVNLRFHDLRRTTATRLGEDGTDLTTIAEFLGHRFADDGALHSHAGVKETRGVGEIGGFRKIWSQIGHNKKARV